MAIATRLHPRPPAVPPRLRAPIANALKHLWAALKGFGPYAAIELILPGGSCLVLLLWLYRRHQRLARAVTGTRAASDATECWTPLMD